ncbi:MAG: response regulator transcription factor [Verrucomicrobia bacterium]|nr:response regulator transcription factor [Verrucomicrobiota bacterium]
MQQKIKILILDDHPVFRHGLKQVIQADPDYVVVGEAGDGVAALEVAQACPPDIAVLDIDVPKLTGLEVARRLLKSAKPPAIIILSMYDTESMVNEALDLPVNGYVLKDNAIADILNSLRAVASGQCYVSSGVAKYLMKRRSQSAKLSEQKKGLDSLTAMERRVLKLIAENKTSKIIASELFLSPRTVDTHRQNIAAKLELHGTRAVFQFAIEHKAAL